MHHAPAGTAPPPRYGHNLGVGRQMLSEHRARVGWRRLRLVYIVAFMLLTVGVIACLYLAWHDFSSSSSSSAARPHLGTRLLHAMHRRLGATDRTAVIIDRDRGLPHIMALAGDAELARTVRVHLRLSGILERPRRIGESADEDSGDAEKNSNSLEAVEEWDGCGDDADAPASSSTTATEVASKRTVVQSFRLVPLGSRGTLESAEDEYRAGTASNRYVLEAALAEARAGRMDEADALGLAGGRFLHFARSDVSGVEVPLHVDLRTGRLLAGPLGHGVVIAEALDLRCWRAIRRRRVVASVGRPIEPFVVPLRLEHVKVEVQSNAGPSD